MRPGSNPRPNPFLQRGSNFSMLLRSSCRGQGSCVSILLPQAFGYPSSCWIYTPDLPVAPGSLHPGLNQFVLTLALTVEQSLTPQETLPCGKQAFPSSRPRDAEEWTPGDGRGVMERAETQCWLSWSLLHHVPLGFPGGFPLPASRGVFLAPKPSLLSPQHELRRPHKPEAGSRSGSECTGQI